MTWIQPAIGARITQHDDGRCSAGFDADSPIVAMAGVSSAGFKTFQAAIDWIESNA